MAKPPPSTPHSDMRGVHQDEVARNDPRVMDEQSQEQMVERQEESAGRPATDEGEKRGRASSRYIKPEGR